MKQDSPSLAGNRARRAAWFAANARPGMIFEDAIRLNDQGLRLFPVTLEEREQKGRDLEDMSEFVL